MLEILNSYFEGGLIQTALAWVVTIIFAFVVYRLAKRFLDRVTIDNEQTILLIIKSFIIFAAAYTCLKRVAPLNGLMSTILASSGILALAVSLAAQDSFGNMIAGIIIVLTKPYKIGDLIKVDSGKFIGYVEKITLRHTVIRTYENNRIAIPNTTMSASPIENYDLVDSEKANFLEVQISYESDLDTAMNLLKEMADNHPLCLGGTTVKVTGFGDSGINLRVTIKTENSLKGFNVMADMRHDIIYAFKEKGIEIPYPTRTVELKKETTTKRKPRSN